MYLITPNTDRVSRRISVVIAALLLPGLLGCAGTSDRAAAGAQVDLQYVHDQANVILAFVAGRTDRLSISQQASTEVGDDSFTQRIAEYSTAMRNRATDIARLKGGACAGVDRRGYVRLRDCGELLDNEKKNAAQKLIAAENGDRKALYKALAKKDPDNRLSKEDVELVFAAKLRERAQAGAIVQLPDAGATFDAFKASERGAALGAACQPETWVTLR